MPPSPVAGRPTAPVPEPIEESVRIVPTPPREAERPRAGMGTSLGKTIRIRGELQAKEDVYIAGSFQGNLQLADNRLTVGPGGKCESAVKAREVVVLGVLQGNVEATDRVSIGKEGQLIGDLKTTGIHIEEGAYFKGSVDIMRTDKRAPAAETPAGRDVPAEAAMGQRI
jgi:cytoskeletal protein CcmA (bactofilin family)